MSHICVIMEDHPWAEEQATVIRDLLLTIRTYILCYIGGPQ